MDIGRWSASDLFKINSVFTPLFTPNHDFWAFCHMVTFWTCTWPPGSCPSPLIGPSMCEDHHWARASPPEGSQRVPGAHAHALRHTPAHVRPRHARARYSGRYRAAGRACPGAAGGGSCEGCPSGGSGHLGGLGGDVDGAQSRLQGSREGLSEVGKGGREAAGRWIRGLGAATHLHARPRRARMRPAHRGVEAGRLRRCSGRGSGRGLLQLTVGEAVVGGGGGGGRSQRPTAREARRGALAAQAMGRRAPSDAVGCTLVGSFATCRRVEHQRGYDNL